MNMRGPLGAILLVFSCPAAAQPTQIRLDWPGWGGSVNVFGNDRTLKDNDPAPRGFLALAPPGIKHIRIAVDQLSGPVPESFQFMLELSSAEPISLTIPPASHPHCTSTIIGGLESPQYTQNAAFMALMQARYLFHKECGPIMQERVKTLFQKRLGDLMRELRQRVVMEL